MAPVPLTEDIFVCGSRAGRVVVAFAAVLAVGVPMPVLELMILLRLELDGAVLTRPRPDAM